MQEVQDKVSIEPGLRARKRAETHARIQTEGMELFLTKGFDATTLDEIALAADVSRRTLLNYFGSKEEIVFSTKAGFPEMVAEAVRTRSSDEPLLEMVENAFTAMAGHHQSDQAWAVASLIRATPSLQAGDQAKHELIERLLAETLADHTDRVKGDIDCRVVAGAAVTIMKLATDAWLAEPGENPLMFARKAFAALRRVAA